MKIWTTSSGCPDDMPEKAREIYNGLIPYIEEFLVNKHPFRKGVVCPFMPPALKNDEVYYLSVPSLNKAECIQVIERMCNYYLSTARQGAGAVIIMFDSEQDIRTLLQAHIKMKKYCIRRGLMLGVLFKDSDASSLHSDDFYPLRTPTPVMVIRDVTISDLQFLQPNHHSVIDKIDFLNSYIRKFSSRSKKSKVIADGVDEALALRKIHLGYLIKRLSLAASFMMSVGCLVWWGLHAS